MGNKPKVGDIITYLYDGKPPQKAYISKVSDNRIHYYIIAKKSNKMELFSRSMYFWECFINDSCTKVLKINNDIKAVETIKALYG